MKVSLTRTVSRTDGVFGTLAVNNLPVAVTLERPWLDNKKSVSCIPAGTYIAKRIVSPSHGNVFEVTGVKDRQHILFHIGNTIKDSEGCILVGSSFGIWSDGSCCILASGKAFTEFMRLLAGVNEFTLVISEHFN